jgi:hypothetical protein
MYMLTLYFIYGKCVDITLNHHLQLKVQYDFTHATKGFLVINLIITVFITNCNRKLLFLLIM